MSMLFKMKKERIFAYFIFGLMFWMIVYSLYTSYDKHSYQKEIEKEEPKNIQKYRDY